MAKRVFKNIAIIAGMAAAAGFVAGLLSAPKSGKQTRNDIGRAARRGLSEVEHQLKALSSELGDVLAQAKDQSGALKGKASAELVGLTDKASVAREKVREMITAVHEGDTDDEDLKASMAQASRALKHLQDYLKK